MKTISSAGRRPALVATLALAAACAASAAPAAAQLDEAERRIIEYVEAEMDRALADLERSVNINSGTMNSAGIRRVAEALLPEFRELGFEARYVPLPDSLRRGGHLVAERLGTRGLRLLLIGHLDTVFEEDSPFQRFELVDQSTARGPGVEDMKGGNIVILQALRAMHAVGALEGATIRVVLTGDEESPGRPLAVSRASLIDAARQSDVALGFEAGSRSRGIDYGVIARRSSNNWLLRTTGVPAHSSGIFGERTGAGAVFEAARILEAFYSQVRGERYLTFNPGLILGGDEVAYDRQNTRGTVAGKTNIVASSAVVHGGIRTITREQYERAQDIMRRIVAVNLPGTTAEIEFDDGYPPMPPTEENLALLARFSEVNVDLGQGEVLPFDPGGRGAADVSFVAEHVQAAMDGLGVHGSGGHTVEETMDLSTFPLVIQRAAIFMYRLTQEPVIGR